ncbi:superoxide dismutase [Babesia caballi]|uniref:Superoxide dismutase [Fe] n=1 Tax=Babesia caballi TaxID=5871 RepID=A0AAV4LRD9_BABCB|nr:superoxide dismutase [Babesia caballi]
MGTSVGRNAGCSSVAVAGTKGGGEPFKLMELPYVGLGGGGLTVWQGMSDLEPRISRETIEFHYLKHHAGYVKKLNEFAAQQPDLAAKTVEDLVKTADGVVYNMAAQVWNHDFYWLGMSPQSDARDAPVTASLVDKSFGSMEALKEQITQMAAGNVVVWGLDSVVAHFGSGWVWLLYDQVTDALELVATKDADNPVRRSMGKPVLVVGECATWRVANGADVWEHAYYIDYRNDKVKYTHAWFDSINWKRTEEIVSRYREERSK